MEWETVYDVLLDDWIRRQVWGDLDETKWLWRYDDTRTDSALDPDDPFDWLDYPRYDPWKWGEIIGGSDELPKYDYPDSEEPKEPSFWDAVREGRRRGAWQSIQDVLQHLLGVAPIGSDAGTPKKLKRLHGDDTLDKSTLNHWRNKSNEEIIESLTRQGPEHLKIRPDGTVLQGNHRIKVLQERGYDTSKLYHKAEIMKKQPIGPLQ